MEVGGKITVYWSSVSGNLQIKKAQGHIFDTLHARRIPYQEVDVAAPAHVAQREGLRERSPLGLTLPQIWVDGEYRAGYDAFYEAVENEQLPELLRSQGCDKEAPF